MRAALVFVCNYRNKRFGVRLTSRLFATLVEMIFVAISFFAVPVWFGPRIEQKGPPHLRFGEDCRRCIPHQPFLVLVSCTNLLLFVSKKNFV